MLKHGAASGKKATSLDGRCLGLGLGPLASPCLPCTRWRAPTLTPQRRRRRLQRHAEAEALGQHELRHCPTTARWRGVPYVPRPPRPRRRPVCLSCLSNTNPPAVPGAEGKIPAAVSLSASCRRRRALPISSHAHPHRRRHTEPPVDHVDPSSQGQGLLGSPVLGAGAGSLYMRTCHVETAAGATFVAGPCRGPRRGDGSRSLSRLCRSADGTGKSS